MQLVMQNIKLLQVLTKQQEDVISNQQVALQGLDKAIARERYTSRVENLWSSGKAKYSDMVAQ